MSCKKWQSFNRNNQVRPRTYSTFAFSWHPSSPNKGYCAKSSFQSRPMKDSLGGWGRPFLFSTHATSGTTEYWIETISCEKSDTKNIVLLTKLTTTISERQDCWFKRDSRQKVAQVCQSCWTSFHQPGEFVEIRFRGVATSKEGPQIGPNQKPQPRSVERNEGAN